MKGNNILFGSHLGHGWIGIVKFQTGSGNGLTPKCADLVEPCIIRVNVVTKGDMILFGTCEYKIQLIRQFALYLIYLLSVLVMAMKAPCGFVAQIG